MSDTETLEAQNDQRVESRRATFETLRNKKRAQREVSIVLVEGEEPVTFLFRAIGSVEYDRLLTDNPPTKDQIAQGSSFNVNTFGPALLSKVVADPAMTVAEWTEIWTSPEWSGGEISTLYGTAMELCSRNLNLGPIAAG